METVLIRIVEATPEAWLRLLSDYYFAIMAFLCLVVYTQIVAIRLLYQERIVPYYKRPVWIPRSMRDVTYHWKQDWANTCIVFREAFYFPSLTTACVCVAVFFVPAVAFAAVCISIGSFAGMGIPLATK